MNHQERKSKEKRAQNAIAMGFVLQSAYDSPSEQASGQEDIYNLVHEEWCLTKYFPSYLVRGKIQILDF